MTLDEMERLFAAIDEALSRLPTGQDPAEAIRGVGRRLGILTPDPFVASILTARAGGDVQVEAAER